MKHTILLLLSCCSCLPDLGPPSSLILGPRILAVRSEPAEVSPGESVQLQVFAADPQGPVAAMPVEWAFCAAPKSPVENNVVSEHCLEQDVRVLADSASLITTQIPSDACELFGPQLPPSTDGQTSLRPRDPDGTGGYYQPVRLRMLGMTAFGLVRIRCGLPLATPEVAAQFRMTYVPNRNPQLGALSFLLGDAVLLPTALPMGQTLTLKLSIPQDARESFVRFDPAAQSLRTMDEQLRVSWLSAQGSFRAASTDVSNEQTYSEWRTPEQPGPALLWTILRDSRGGVVTQSHAVQVVRADS